LSAAWFLRFDFAFPYPLLVLTAAPMLVVCRWISLSGFRLTHHYWRYTGIGDLADLLKSILVGSLLFLIVSRLISYNSQFPKSLPLSIYVTEAVLSFLLLATLRVGAALVLQERAVRRGRERTEILIIGAGYAGAMLLKGLHATKYAAIGLLDDNQDLHRSKVCGCPVLGSIDCLPEIAKQHGVQEVLIAIPSATGSQMLRISDYCARAGVVYRAVPSLTDLFNGKHSITEVRELNLDDLLGREPITLESVGVRTRLCGRVVMVTGAAGSIGSELCKQIVRYAPDKIICVDQSETPLFHLQQLLLGETKVPVICCVTDVGNKARMRQLLDAYQVRVIFHAAAYKHVPMVEANSYDGVRNNVFALLDLFEVAEECGCEDFLLISTDKAVNPSSLMGCTKRLGEMVVASRRGGAMRCVSVRFGNVLGSQGSVIPLFRSQIREGRAITVTHPQITRYFMTIPEAVSLTLQAFTIGKHGDILVLDMGDPILIVDLAKTLIRISGKTEKEIPIVFTGLRPGEKLHELLFYDSEKRLQTGVQKVMRAQNKQMNWFYLQRGLRELESAMRSHDDYQIRCMIKELIPEYEWTPDTNRQKQLAAQNRTYDGEIWRVRARFPQQPRHSAPSIPAGIIQLDGGLELYASEETLYDA
jgi:FlaA1/EpsC-like NDP-sugar epimerase